MQRDEFETMADRGLIRPENIDLVTSITMRAAIEVIMEHIVGKKRLDIEGLADSLLLYHARALVPEEMNIDEALGRVLSKPKKSSPGDERKSA